MDRISVLTDQLTEITNSINGLIAEYDVLGPELVEILDTLELRTDAAKEK